MKISNQEQGFKALVSLFDVGWYDNLDLIIRAGEVMKIIRYWLERDKMLSEEPTVEETVAGVKAVGEEVGMMGLCLNIAERFSLDPDVVWDWTYEKCWQIAKVWYLQNKYRENLQKAHEKKSIEFKDGKTVGA